MSKPSQPLVAETVTAQALHGLLNEYQVAEVVGMSVASVRRWRLFRQGPKYLKIGAAVRYKPEDVAAWLALRPTGGGTEAAQ
jgi:predicted DNA-binding transcriptional regulator AlpA